MSHDIEMVECPVCEGDGEHPNSGVDCMREPCPLCWGTKTINKEFLSWLAIWVKEYMEKYPEEFVE